MMVVIVVSAFRSGLRPALAVALIANLYTFFAFSAPYRNVEPLINLLRGEWLIIIFYFGPALIVGYLSERVVMLLGRERAAREMAEQEQMRLTTILQQLPVGVVIAEASTGEVIFGNQYLEQLLGHTSVGNNISTEVQPNGAIIGHLSRPNDVNSSPMPVPLEEWPLKQVIEGQVLQNEEYAYTHEGHDHVLRVSGAPIYNTHNTIAAGVVIIDDITEEKELQQRKDDFLSMVSHELKTPLTSLKMYVQLASRQLANASSDLDRQVIRSLDKANMQADKVTQTISDMLTLAKAQSGKLEYRFEQTDLFKLVQITISDLQATYSTHTLKLTGRSVGLVEVDADRLGQVIINLVTNAIKYSPQADSVIVSVTEDKGQATISVQDFGIGIKASEQNRIFERFYQSTDKSGRTSSGLGVGLYLCAEIIKQHGGKIWLTSQPGKGSTFYVAIPFKQPKP